MTAFLGAIVYVYLLRECLTPRGAAQTHVGRASVATKVPLGAPSPTIVRRRLQSY